MSSDSDEAELVGRVAPDVSVEREIGASAPVKHRHVHHHATPRQKQQPPQTKRRRPTTAGAATSTTSTSASPSPSSTSTVTSTPRASSPPLSMSLDTIPTPSPKSTPTIATKAKPKAASTRPPGSTTTSSSSNQAPRSNAARDRTSGGRGRNGAKAKPRGPPGPATSNLNDNEEDDDGANALETTTQSLSVSASEDLPDTISSSSPRSDTRTPRRGGTNSTQNQTQNRRPHTSGGEGTSTGTKSAAMANKSQPQAQSRLAVEASADDILAGVEDSDSTSHSSSSDGGVGDAVKRVVVDERPMTANSSAAAENKRRQQLEQMERRKMRSRQGVLATTDRPLTGSGTLSTPRTLTSSVTTTATSAVTIKSPSVPKAHVEEFQLKDPLEQPSKPSGKHRHPSGSSGSTSEESDQEDFRPRNREDSPVSLATSEQTAALSLSATKSNSKHKRKSSQEEEVEMTSLKHDTNTSDVNTSSASASLSHSAPLTPHYTTGTPGMPQLQWAPSPLDNVSRYRPTLSVPTLVANDVPTFLHTPGQRGYMTMCKIQVASKGFGHPTYLLYLEETNQFIVAARRRVRSKSSNYLISTDSADLARNSPCFAGKVRSNFLGTEFVIYDTGDNPKKAVNPDMSRCELASVTYGSNPLGLHGPRKMVVLLPKRDAATGGYIGNRPDSPSSTLLARYKSNTLDNILCLHNKAPIWNQATQAYVLNFHRRVKVASVKNFQVVSADPSYNDIILMQFGRVSSNMFILDYQYPLTLMQAFGIALTSFDKKLACE
ncbi:TULP3 protein [Pelomyxa schiedti]|nr:TULP3 protein [Pelomyxa schiedti]